MKSHIHHAALNVAEFEWYVDFFLSVFGMTVQRTAGEKPMRKVWFHEGIQLNECETSTVCGNACDHISLAVEDISGTVEATMKSDCSALSDGPHWFALPNGVRVELKSM